MNIEIKMADEPTLYIQFIIIKLKLINVFIETSE